jgi:outer membrane protein assembly factor BamB
MSSMPRVMLPRWAVIRDARRRQRRRWRRRATGLLALAAMVGGADLVLRDSGAGAPATAAPLRADLLTARLGGDVLGAEAVGDRVWVDTCADLYCGAADTGLDSERLVEVDARTGAVLRRLPVLTNMDAWTVAPRSIWIAHLLSGEVARLDPVSGHVTARLRLRLAKPVAGHDRQFLPENMEYANGSVWVSTARGRLAQIDAHTGELVRMIPTPSEDNATAIDRHATWVAEGLEGIGLLRRGASRLRIHTIMRAGLPLNVYEVFAGTGVVWALAFPDSTAVSHVTLVLALDPRTGRVIHRVRVAVNAFGATVTAGSLYVADFFRGRIYRVSREGTLRTFVTPRRHAWLVAGSPGALWAAENVGRGGRQGRLLRLRLPGA